MAETSPSDALAFPLPYKNPSLLLPTKITGTLHLQHKRRQQESCLLQPRRVSGDACTERFSVCRKAEGHAGGATAEGPAGNTATVAEQMAAGRAAGVSCCGFGAPPSLATFTNGNGSNFFSSPAHRPMSRPWMFPQSSDPATSMTQHLVMAEVAINFSG